MVLVHNTAIIGNQIWMMENLKVTRYNDGSVIPMVTEGTAWSNLTTPAYCWFDNDGITFKDNYGALYNWYAVNTGKLCPAGWHVPTDAEWTALTDYLGGNNNKNGFKALPVGGRYGKGYFYGIGRYGTWWSSTEHSAPIAWGRNVHCRYGDCGTVMRDNHSKRIGFSTRCVKN